MRAGHSGHEHHGQADGRENEGRTEVRLLLIKINGSKVYPKTVIQKYLPAAAIPRGAAQVIGQPQDKRDLGKFRRLQIKTAMKSMIPKRLALPLMRHGA